MFSPFLSFRLPKKLILVAGIGGMIANVRVLLQTGDL
jgi:hypothetical protein